MNFRMLKKKYRKMYGQNPPKWMKERLIKTMVSPSEYRVITAIGIKANFNLQCASMSTKLAFQSMVDRGAMTPNEWRAILNLAPIEGGDKPIRRLDTQVVDMLESMLNKMNGENYREMAGLMGQLLKAAYIEMHGGEKKVET